MLQADGTACAMVLWQGGSWQVGGNELMPRVDEGQIQ